MILYDGKDGRILFPLSGPQKCNFIKESKSDKSKRVIDTDDSRKKLIKVFSGYRIYDDWYKKSLMRYSNLKNWKSSPEGLELDSISRIETLISEFSSFTNTLCKLTEEELSLAKPAAEKMLLSKSLVEGSFLRLIEKLGEEAGGYRQDPADLIGEGWKYTASEFKAIAALERIKRDAVYGDIKVRATALRTGSTPMIHFAVKESARLEEVYKKADQELKELLKK